MTCRELEQFLDPYLDGEFGPEERLEIERHLPHCLDCAKRVNQERSLRETLRAKAREATRLPAPLALRQKVLAGIQIEQRRAAVSPWVRLSAVMMVVAGVAGGVELWWYFRPPTRQRFLDDATRWYSKRLPHESRPNTPEQVEAWFVNKVDHRVSPPHLAEATLEGVRLLSVQDRPAAYISYNYRKLSHGAPEHRVAVFVFEDLERDVEAGTRPKVWHNRGYNVALWREDTIVYELVADLDEPDILQMLTERQRKAPVPSTDDLQPETRPLLLDVLDRRPMERTPAP